MSPALHFFLNNIVLGMYTFKTTMLSAQTLRHKKQNKKKIRFTKTNYPQAAGDIRRLNIVPNKTLTQKIANMSLT